MRRLAWAGAIASLFPAASWAAVTIMSVTAATPSLEQDLRVDANSVLAVHWTSPGNYSNVTVSAKLYCTPCMGKNDAAFADAYLVTQIGPLATAANQVAYARVRISGARTFVPLFTGVTMVPGDYYLVVYSPTQTGRSTDPAVAWVGTSDANALVSNVPGATREQMLIYTNNSASALINSQFPPSSFFFRSPTTPAYDLTGAYNLQYQVTSTPSVIVPQIVTGGGWKTTIALANLDTSPVSYSIKFQDDNGAPLSLSLLPGGSAPVGTLNPGESFFAEVAPSSSLLQGSAEITASGRLGVSTGLRQAGAGTGAYQEASYTTGGSATGFAFLFDNIQGATSIALANASATASLRVSLSAQTEDGRTLDTTVELRPRGHSAFALTSILPGAAGARGLLKVTAASPDLSAVGLRFDPNGSFTAVPALQ